MQPNPRFVTRRRKVATALAALGLAGATLTAFGPSAGADTVSGAIGVRSTGSIYAGADEPDINSVSGEVARVVPAGKPAKFSVEAVNTGTTPTAYLFFAVPFALDGAITTLNGKSDITDQADTTGFLTDTLAPGKRQLFTVVLTLPPDATPDEISGAEVGLESSDGTQDISAAVLFASVTSTKGSTDHDLFVKAAGQGTVRASSNGSDNGTSAPVIRSGKKATFTMTLRNDSAAAANLTVTSQHDDVCNNFTTTVRSGKNDVTDAMASGTYSTGTLAPKKSVVFTVTVTNLGQWAPTCGWGNLVADQIFVDDGVGGTSQVALVTAGQ